MFFSKMGHVPSRLPLPTFVNTLQSALPSRSDRRVEPVPEFQSDVSVSTPVLTARRDRNRRFRTSFWKRSRKRTSCSCQIIEDDDYTRVFGSVRPDSNQSLPLVCSVRRCRPDFPTALPPPEEYRLFVQRIEVVGQTPGSHYYEQVKTYYKPGLFRANYEYPNTYSHGSQTTQINSETRVVRCRHCRNGSSACSSTVSSHCGTPLPQTASHPLCRACCWHNLPHHDCGCFGPPLPFSSWDTENSRPDGAHSTQLPSCGGPRTKLSVDITPEPDETKSKKAEDSPGLEGSAIKINLISGQKPVQESEQPETTTCVCPVPSKEPCACDKRLFEAMNPWNKFKTFLFVILTFALLAWIVTFIIIG